MDGIFVIAIIGVIEVISITVIILLTKHLRIIAISICIILWFIIEVERMVSSLIDGIPEGVRFRSWWSRIRLVFVLIGLFFICYQVIHMGTQLSSLLNTNILILFVNCIMFRMKVSILIIFFL